MIVTRQFSTIRLDKESGIPLYRQLGDALCGLIEDGILQPNAKLPPIRKMAEALHVNNVTVVNAYKYLENKKIVYSQMGSGTYVSEKFDGELPEPVLQNQYQAKSNWTYDGANAINFANSSTSVDLFPVDEFKLIFNQVLDRDRGGAFDYQESPGYEPLRETVCGYLTGYGIRTTPDNVQIISGAQQGIDIISKIMLSMGDVLFVERPTYYGAVGAFLSRGGQVVEVPIEQDGMDVDRLESLMKIYRPKFIYVMPYYQTPTCCCYSMGKKRRLLEMAAKYDTYIIEEDNQSEFHYTQEAIVPLKALDYKNRVVYIKSFSKILMRGLRIGFMVLPPKIMRKVSSVRHASDIATSGFIQRAFDLYLQSDYWESHRRSMNRIFNARYLCAKENIMTHLAEHVKVCAPEGGLSFWLEVKSKKIAVGDLCNRLMNRNVLVTPGAVFSMTGEDMPFFRLSFAAVERPDIEKGIRTIGDVFIELR